MKSGLLGASESGPLLAGLGVDVTWPEGLIVGVLVTGAAAFGRLAADGGTAMGWICASAGLTASEPIAVNHKRERESRSGLNNLFI